MDEKETDHSGGIPPPFPFIIISVQTKQMGLSKNGIIDSLQDLYGTEFTAADVRAWCAMNGCAYQTITNLSLIHI